MDGDDEARGTSARVLDAVVLEVVPQTYLFSISSSLSVLSMRV